MTKNTLTIVAGVALIGLGASTGAQEHRHERSSISVSGTGKLSTKPDVAEVRVGVVTQAPTAQAALAANNKAMTQLHETLKEHGVADKDVQTAQIQVAPQYSQPGPRPLNEAQIEFIPRIVGYRVENTVLVTARRIPQLGELLDASVQGGANQVYGISFRIDEPEKLLDEARKHAVADAKRKADLLAGEAGVVLGPPLRIVEESEMTPLPRFNMAAGARMLAAAAMPIAAGEQELRVTVQIVYALKAPK